MYESEDAFLAAMDRDGCIREFAWDENGELMISWNMDVLREKHPDVADAIEEIHLEMVQESLSSMTDKGLLHMSFQENDDGEIEAVYSLTEEGERLAESLSITDEYERFYPPENL